MKRHLWMLMPLLTIVLGLLIPLGSIRAAQGPVPSKPTPAVQDPGPAKPGTTVTNGPSNLSTTTTDSEAIGSYNAQRRTLILNPATLKADILVCIDEPGSAQPTCTTLSWLRRMMALVCRNSTCPESTIAAQ